MKEVVPERERDLEGAVDDLQSLLSESKSECAQLRTILNSLGSKMSAWKTFHPTLAEYEKLPMIFDVLMEEKERAKRRLTERMKSAATALDRSIAKHKRYMIKKRSKAVKRHVFVKVRG